MRFNTKHRTWAEINLDHLIYNYRQALRQARTARAMPVIKADAYGHGAVQAAIALSGAGAERFAVATPEEALQLRRHGIKQPILLLGMVSPVWMQDLIAAGITLALGDMDTARAYASALAGNKAKIHIKLDTGMNRIGLSPQRAVKEVVEISSFPCFEIEGIFTHFSAADAESENRFTDNQLECFDRILRELENAGVHIPIRHCSNSAAIVAHPQARVNWIRPGIMLYGSNPCNATPFELRRPMAFRARIVQVKIVAKGESVGYGRSWYAPRDSLIATVSVGYADGLPRNLSGKVSMIVRGVKAPQVGRICMDMCMLDVTGIPDVQAGDAATIFGMDGVECITADEVAAAAGTISYEVFCAVGRRVPRVYTQNGEIIQEQCYLDLL